MDKDLRWRRLKVIGSTMSAYFGNVLIFLAIIYFLIIVGRSMFNSYQDNKKIDQKKAEISNLRAQVIFLENQNLYYQTESFREKEARKKLGMIKPGENVVALDRSTGNSQTLVAPKEEQIKLPNYLKWWNYFFGG